MKKTFYASVGLVLAALAYFGTPHVAQAAQAPVAIGNLSIDHDNSLTQQVQWGGRCIRWNRVCRRRHGVGPDYRRCMRIHGCGVRRPAVRRCVRWRRVCRYRHGVGPDFRRCMRRHGC